jgi:hypothetical protein
MYFFKKGGLDKELKGHFFLVDQALFLPKIQLIKTKLSF